MSLTREQRRELRGVWGGACNELACLRDLDPAATWLDHKNGSYVCAECAAKMNAVMWCRCSPSVKSVPHECQNTNERSV